MQNIRERLIDFLSSPKVAMAVFAALSLLAIPGTFAEQRAIYSSPPFVLLMVLLGLCTLVCTVRRRKSLASSVMVIHCGVLVVLGGVLVGLGGFVATVNIYEGDTVDTFYRWDQERDVSLDMAVTVRQIHREYYPVAVRVGVLKGSEKVGLYTLKTGESFDLAGSTVRVDALDLIPQKLLLTVSTAGAVIGTADTEGASTLPASFPFTFKLVAFKTPVLKRLWVDLVITPASGGAVTGSAEVNGPFVWRNLNFYSTQVEVDPQGRPYAGIQIVKDPGRPLVFCGFVVIGVGAVLSSGRRLWGKRSRGEAMAPDAAVPLTVPVGEAEPRGTEKELAAPCAEKT